DRHLVADAELPLLDLRDLAPARILEHEGLADPKRLAVDLEGAVAFLVLDPVVVADGQQLLSHAVAGTAGEVVLSASKEWHQPRLDTARSAGASPESDEADRPLRRARSRPDVPLARLLRNAGPAGAAALHAGAFTNRPEPPLPARRRDHER